MSGAIRDMEHDVMVESLRRYGFNWKWDEDRQASNETMMPAPADLPRQPIESIVLGIDENSIDGIVQTGAAGYVARGPLNGWDEEDDRMRYIEMVRYEAENLGYADKFIMNHPKPDWYTVQFKQTIIPKFRTIAQNLRNVTMIRGVASLIKHMGQLSMDKKVK